MTSSNNAAALILLAATLGLAPQSAIAQASPKTDGAKQQAEFYKAEVVQTIHLTITEDNLRKMATALPKRIYVPATFRWQDIVIENVGVRYKGNSSSNPRQQHKRGFLIKFSKFDKKSRFIGLQRASLDNGVQFGSLFSEPIVTDILRDLDVPTYRCNYARLMLNGRFHGVYTNVERIDQTFVASHLPDKQGALFKVDEGGPGCNLQLISDNPRAYAKTFEPKNKPAEKNGGELVDLIKVINQPATDEFTQRLEMDTFLRTTAVMLFAGAFDQLTGWQSHNYYLYRDSQNKRWHYLPWDLDVGFSETAFGRINVIDDWNAAWPVPTTGMPNPLLERIMASPVLLKKYRETAKTILLNHFEPDQLSAAIDAKYQLIKADLQDDPFPHRRVTSRQNEDYDTIVASMESFVRKRFDIARQQLESPGPRPEFVGRQPDNQPNGMPPGLAKKIQTVQQRTKQLQQKMKAVQKLMQQIGPLMQQGKTEAAEKLMDELLRITDQ